MLNKLDNRFSFSKSELKNQVNKNIKEIDVVKEVEDNINLIISYLGDYVLYNDWINSINIKLHRSIPDDVKETCNVCRGDRNLSEDIICKKYFDLGYEMIVLHIIFYVSYIENNKHLFNSKESLLSMTNEFFDNFEAYNGELFFDAKRLDDMILTNSLMIMRESFTNLETQNAIWKINQMIEELQTHKVISESTGRTLFDHVKPQIKFLKKQLKYYEKKLLTEPLIMNAVKNLDKVSTTNVNNVDFKSLLEMGNTFCRSMPMDIPIEHFKVLTIKKSKNGKPFLTQDEFEVFIKKAFLGIEGLEKQKFNQAPKGEKFKIQYLFRQFYENYCYEYFDTGQNQDIFIRLLTDNFKGWDFENVKNNFNTKPKSLI